MQNKKDLLQAHRLMTLRASQALILGEPDTGEFPLRRINVATVSGVMVAVLLLAGFGIWGLISPGAASGLQAAGTLIIEKESGARYIWCQQDKLCPVENFVSARLLASSTSGSSGAGQVTVRLVSRNSLKGFQRGAELGIPGAPNTLPAGTSLLKGPWSACVATEQTRLSALASIVTLNAGKDAGGQALSSGQAIAVQANGQTWLLQNGQRQLVQQGLAGNLAPNAPSVAAKWLNTVPQGQDFGVPAIDGLGNEVRGPQGNARVGQIFKAVDQIGNTSTYYVMLSDGLERIQPGQAELLVMDPRTKAAYPGQTVAPINIQAGAVNNVGVSNSNISGKMPQAMPQIQAYANTTPLCIVFDDPKGKTPGFLTVGGTLPAAPKGLAGGDAADVLNLPPGSAALAGSLPAVGGAASVSTYFLVTEGRKFALKSPDVMGNLGYDATEVTEVPDGVLSLVPTGVILDPNAAKQSMPVTTQPSAPSVIAPTPATG